jgi:predicted DNA-binding transcriptional regulator YafY
MNREAWHRPTDAATAAKRATGRKKFNERRKQAAAARRQQVRQAINLGRRLWSLEALAARFHVSLATMSRDLAVLGVDLAKLRARYDAFDFTPPTVEQVQRVNLDMALMLGGVAARLAARLQGAPLTPEQDAAADAADAARDRILASADEVRARLRARFGLGDE